MCLLLPSHVMLKLFVYLNANQLKLGDIHFIKFYFTFTQCIQVNIVQYHIERNCDQLLVLPTETWIEVFRGHASVFLSLILRIRYDQVYDS